MPLQWGTWKNRFLATRGPMRTGSRRTSCRGSGGLTAASGLRQQVDELGGEADVGRGREREEPLAGVVGEPERLDEGPQALAVDPAAPGELLQALVGLLEPVHAHD